MGEVFRPRSDSAEKRIYEANAQGGQLFHDISIVMLSDAASNSEQRASDDGSQEP